MTQPVKQDERVLDYIYGELDEGERTAFEAQLAEDATLRAEVESLQGVSKAFRGLPKVTQSPDSVQRMTALLMQQATAQVAQGPSRTDKAAQLEAARVVEAEAGAKVIPLRRSSLRRIFTSPTSGIFAAAAAALFWVVLKSQTPTPLPPPGEAKLEPVAMAPPPPPAGAPAAVAVPPAAPTPEVPADNVPIKTAFSEALKQEKPVAGNGAGMPPSSEPTTLAMGRSSAGPMKKGAYKAKEDLDSLLDSAAGKNWAGKPADKKPLIVAMAPTEKKSAAADDYDGRRYAQPPPPMRERAEEAPPQEPQAAKPTLRQQLAQTVERRKDRIVEELSNQELGNMPGRGAPAGAPPPAAAPPPPPAIAEAESNRYAQAPSQAAPSTDEVRGSGGAASNVESQNYAGPQTSSGHAQNQASAPRRVANVNEGDRDSGGNGLLQTAQEHIRHGRCAEANSVLSRVEQAFPATAGLAETRTQWQRSCQVMQQNQAGTPAIQMPQAAPAPPAKPAPRMMDMEQAYPSSPSPSPSNVQNKAPAYRAKKAAPAPTQQQKMRSYDKKAADSALY